MKKKKKERKEWHEELGISRLKYTLLYEENKKKKKKKKRVTLRVSLYVENVRSVTSISRARFSLAASFAPV